MLLLFFLLVAGTITGHGNIAPKPKAVLQTDTAAITVRHFNTDSLKYFAQQREFQYQENTGGMSAWTRFWKWFWQTIGHLFDFSPSKGHVSPFFYYFFIVLKYLILALGLGALIVLILKLVGLDLLSLFRRKSKVVSLPYSEYIEDINQINFDAEIDAAVAGHNYRFAVRLLYLKCLKHLSDAQIIKWQIDKTNSAYINEINNAGQRAAFNILTRQFEYIWYGEFFIDGQLFNTISQSFQKFNKDIA